MLFTGKYDVKAPKIKDLASKGTTVKNTLGYRSLFVLPSNFLPFTSNIKDKQNDEHLLYLIKDNKLWLNLNCTFKKSNI